ncbi:acetyl-CoA carboxylase biotin carboxyl carrier protein [Clostridium bovifaecis]|uniref:Biotin carboxyl carrier protein of acetyl-CoA carboxylase n=1 Tax=Clostridium bovifaecis TaxID=2184719 RepID=A0A6I6F0L8_9CLOT|nr:acetyl-CoA carboxylase biotin carboxyl carrier protein [Clostridium bovifaecis]
MNYKEICEIIKTVSDSNLNFAEVKTADLYIKMEKGSVVRENKSVAFSTKEETEEKAISEEDSLECDKKCNEVPDEKDNIETINSPLVGTFYKAASPDSEPYVKIGAKVRRGDIVCIVEAMKLMNEIEAALDGEIIEILVEDGEMVEYNQPLFKIKKTV